MATSSDNDDRSSNDDLNDSIFHDANDQLDNDETTISSQEQPRWRLSSRDNSIERPEQSWTVSLTENQRHTIQIRDKLQKLRIEDKHAQSSLKLRENLSGENQSSNSIILKVSDHDEKKDSILSEQLFSSHQLSSNQTNEYPFNEKIRLANSESNLFDLKTIDRITKYGQMTPSSGKLNDEEILHQPIVYNRDTGKYVPLSDTNPMMQTIFERVHGNTNLSSLSPNSTYPNTIHIRKNSSDIVKSDSNLSQQKQRNNNNNDDDDEYFSSSDSSSTKSGQTITTSTLLDPSDQSLHSIESKKSSMKQPPWSKLSTNIFRRKQKNNDEQQNQVDIDEDENEKSLINDGLNGDLKYKASRYLNEKAQFDKTQLLQTIVNAHTGPICCMRFSPDGHLLATGGEDCLLKVWVLKSAEVYFNDFSRLTSSSQSEILTKNFQEFYERSHSETPTLTVNSRSGLSESQVPLFSKPFCELSGHQKLVLDVAWSKSLFLLSSSMDQTVRLWHLSRSECLCFFRHGEEVSAIAFHPRDDRYFISGSLDGYVRLWNIPDKRVVYWSLVPVHASPLISVAQTNRITAVNFCDEGRKVTVGTFDGRFFLYTDSLQYETVMNIGEKDASRSHRSRKKWTKAYKITGIESLNLDHSRVLITSIDSRIRLYNIRMKEIERKYRGYSNQSSPIRASLSHDDRYIISGSEDGWFYIWRTEMNRPSSLTVNFSRRKYRDPGRAYERICVHNTIVTSAIFAPNPMTIMNYLYSSMIASSSSSTSIPNVNNQARSPTFNSMEEPIYVIITADSKGQLKILVNRYHRSM